jgi:hypothetical protein
VFTRFINLADDFGNFEGSTRRLQRIIVACTASIKTEEQAIAVMSDLHDADLVRAYRVGDRELWHLPRTRPHRQYIVRKVPASPWDGDLVLGKAQRVRVSGIAKDQQNQALTENLHTTSQPHAYHVAKGVGVGEGVGEGITPPATPGPPADAGMDSKPMTMTIKDLVSEGVDAQTAADWMKVRRAKKAPLTRTAWDSIKAEAEKAGITPAEAVRVSAASSWQGFKASWLKREKAFDPFEGAR